MSLRSKIILILAGVVSLYIGVDHVLQRFLVVRGFAELEKSLAFRDVSRARAGIDAETNRLGWRGRSWTQAGDLSEILEREDSAAIRAFMQQAELELLYVCSLDGEVLWGRIEDPVTRAPLALREFPRGSLSTGHPLIVPAETGQLVEGVTLTEKGPLLVTSWPVPPETGDLAGGHLVILGRFLTQRLIADIGSRMQVDFSVLSMEELAEQRAASPLIDEVTMSSEPVTVESEDGELHAYSALTDLRRVPILLIRADVDRQTSTNVIRYAAVSSLTTALLILLLLMRLLQKFVINPIARLTEHATSIGLTDDITRRLDMDREDEVGLLANEFNRMLEKLAQSRADLARTARLVGMSEIATGVLHNVGNSLNSVNISTALASRISRTMPVDDLRRVVEVLQENEYRLVEFLIEDPQGMSFLPFLRELSSELARHRDALSAELGSLAQGVDQTIELVRSQQNLAGSKGLFEETSASELVDGALGLVAWPERDELEIEVTRELDDLPRFETDPRKCTRILVNLIQNALQALGAPGVIHPRLTLRARRAGHHVQLEVADNGVGIAEEHRTSIFSQGFTTKRDGHGFGLHLSAVSAGELGGSLEVSSDGPGRGASFRLNLPLAPAPWVAGDAEPRAVEERAVER